MSKEKETKSVKEKSNKAIKGVFKKNQIVIAALTVLLGVAGYINFSGNVLDLADSEVADAETAESAFAKTDLEADAGEIVIGDLESEESIQLNSDEEDIGEAVLASTDTASLNAVNIKLNREQVRSRSKEAYLEIINNDGMDEASVQSATEAYIKLTEDMEMEAEAETVLSAKGYTDVVVSIGEDTVDVVVGAGSDLSDVSRAQIEDVVCRKTGCKVEQIVISTIGE